MSIGQTMARAAALVLFIGLVAGVAVSASQFMPGAWYAGLAKPSWTPPGWLFAPVWSVLYLMIAIAGWLVWTNGATSAARWLWPAQLVLNGLWSPTMFGRHEIGLALIVIVGMLVTIIGFIAAAWRTERTAALLFLPYLAWVSFAAALNFAIWRLN